MILDNVGTDLISWTTFPIDNEVFQKVMCGRIPEFEEPPEKVSHCDKRLRANQAK
jgi:hypothetical protein